MSASASTDASGSTRSDGVATSARTRASPATTAVVHRTVEEIWFFLAGRGQMWLASGEGGGEVVDVMPGDCLTIPVGTRFQFRAHGSAPLSAVGVTMPPWPGPDEALVVEGRWVPTVSG